MRRIAVVSDIHGNLTALEAVLADIGSRGAERILCLGDLVGKGPRSDATVDLCAARCDLVLRGNWDDAIAAGEGAEADEYDSWLRRQLGAERLAYLGALPASHEFSFGGKSIRLFHASQLSLYHRVHMYDGLEVHRAMFDNTDFTGHALSPDVVGYGDIHSAYLKNIRGRILFNPGSVGNPLDYPQASYVLLEEGGGAVPSLSIQFVRVPYDIAGELGAAETAAKAEGMPEAMLAHYRSELLTARYRGRKD